MNRRHFCKIASLAAASIGLNPIEAGGVNLHDAPRRDDRAGANGRITSPCRITILRREFHPDLQALFLDDPDAGPCPNFESGDEVRLEAGSGCPDGFCPRLWDAVRSWVNADDRCTRQLHSSTAAIACPDGTRPVIVRVDVNE